MAVKAAVDVAQQRSWGAVEENKLKLNHLNHHKPTLRKLGELMMARVELQAKGNEADGEGCKLHEIVPAAKSAAKDELTKVRFDLTANAMNIRLIKGSH